METFCTAKATLQRITVLILAVLMIAYQQACSQSTFLGDDLLHGRDQITLPFDYSGGFIILDIKFAGLIPLKFIFDTGASNTILFDKYYAELFETAYADTIAVKGADLYNEVEGYIVRNGTFLLPQIDAEVQRDYITLSQNYVKLEESIGIPIGGILGSDFFKRLTVKIDYCRKRITLCNPNKLPINPDKWTQQSIETINGKPYIEAQIDLGSGKTSIKLLLDTGASTSVILHTNKEMGITLPDSSVQGHLGTGLGGSILGHLGFMKSFQMANYEFPNMIANFQTVYEDSLETYHLKGSGIIGNTMMQKFDVVIDYVHSELYVRPNKHFDEQAPQAQSGLILHAFGDQLDQYIVHYVVPNSPAAAAEIKKGDIVSKIGSCKANQYKLHELLKKLQGNPGKKIKLHVLRQKMTLKKHLRLASLLHPH